MNTATARVETLQQVIERKNRETASVRRSLFGKKATNEKIHENLSKCVDIYMDSFRIDPASTNTKEAFKELSLAATLSRRSLKP